MHTNLWAHSQTHTNTNDPKLEICGKHMLFVMFSHIRFVNVCVRFLCSNMNIMQIHFAYTIEQHKICHQIGHKTKRMLFLCLLFERVLVNVSIHDGILCVLQLICTITRPNVDMYVDGMCSFGLVSTVLSYETDHRR